MVIACPDAFMLDIVVVLQELAVVDEAWRIWVVYVVRCEILCGQELQIASNNGLLAFLHGVVLGNILRETLDEH